MPWTIHNSAINGMVYYWDLSKFMYIISFIIYKWVTVFVATVKYPDGKVNSQGFMRFPLFISCPHEVSRLLPKYSPDYIPNISQSYWSLSRWTVGPSNVPMGDSLPARRVRAKTKVLGQRHSMCFDALEDGPWTDGPIEKTYRLDGLQWINKMNIWLVVWNSHNGG